MNSWQKPALIQLPSFGDERGSLSVIEGTVHFPFPLKRIYYLFDVPAGSVRGSHAHKELHQLIIAVNGSFDVVLDNGTDEFCFHLDNPRVGLTIPPGHWRTLENFSQNSVGLVLASLEYSETDYLREYSDFVEWVNTK